MSLQGAISLYPTGSRKYPYFTSGDQSSSKAVIFIGGLFNGLMTPPYLVDLSAALEKAGWRLVQMHWTGAYDGFGTGSLDRDRMEMGCLVKYLREQGLKRIVLMGHSTGSQDVIHYLSRSPSSLSTSKFSTSTSALSPDSLPEVDGGIMQAPASDREYFLHSTTEDGVLWSGQVPFATELVESGRGAEILGEEFCEKADVGINAYRLWSLLAEGGDDDYFSSDIPLLSEANPKVAHPLSQSFGNLSAPALALYSENDEFCKLPDITATLKRWEEAAGGKLEAKVLKRASHAVEEDGPRTKLCEEVVEWLHRVIR